MRRVADTSPGTDLRSTRTGRAYRVDDVEADGTVVLADRDGLAPLYIDGEKLQRRIARGRMEVLS